MRLISPHILHRYEGDLGQPPAIKVAAVDMDVPYVRGLIARYPTTPILLRFIDTAMDQEVPPGCARAWFNRRFPTLDALRAPNILVEFLNEVNQDRAWDYACESAPWIDMMHNAGFRVLWPSPSTGTIRKPGEPGTNVQALYNPVLARLRPRIDGCSPHEYFGNAVTTATPDHITRFRFWPEMLQHDIYIGETGSDANTPGGQAGWRLTFGGDFAAYLEQLKRLDAAYQQWPQVKAACVYSIGECQFGWQQYKIDQPQWDQIVALQEGAMVYRLGPLWERWLGWPITTRHGEMIDPFYTGTRYPHNGVDIGAPEGTPILAPYDGEVDVCALGEGTHADRGNYVWLLRASDLDNPVTGEALDMLVCHLRELPALRTGQRVARGTVIGHVGRTGLATGPHAHVRLCRVRKDKPAYTIIADVDPEEAVAG